MPFLVMVWPENQCESKMFVFEMGMSMFVFEAEAAQRAELPRAIIVKIPAY